MQLLSSRSWSLKIMPVGCNSPIDAAADFAARSQQHQIAQKADKKKVAGPTVLVSDGVSLTPDGVLRTSCKDWVGKGACSCVNAGHMPVRWQMEMAARRRIHVAEDNIGRTEGRDQRKEASFSRSILRGKLTSLIESVTGSECCNSYSFAFKPLFKESGKDLRMGASSACSDHDYGMESLFQVGFQLKSQ